MDQLILASETCDTVNEVVCKPASVLELFELPTIDAFGVNRTILLIALAAIIVIGLLFFAFRDPKLVPGKFQAAMEGLVGMVRDGIARDVIGPEGTKYVPYLLSIFLFILVGNLFEIVPGINFPITSRMALPLFLALLTWVIFLGAGIRKQGIGYFTHLLWPPGVPVALKPLVGLIEFVSTILVRPFSLAVRLFANLVAGHVMLSLLLGSAGFFLWHAVTGEIALGRGAIGVAWFVLGLAIFLFELLVGFLQAYIFTLLSAVYIQTSIHVEH
ncbi:MAG: F0F1 ATP synthase subunit A [Acidimicrobiia bacterium]|nr:F0F1 ATP synthase subunit A [Acidimicrobiia bacterium]